MILTHDAVRKIADLEESVLVAEEQRDVALDRIIQNERDLQVRSPIPPLCCITALPHPLPPVLLFRLCHLPSCQAAAASNEVLSSDLQASKDSAKHLEARVRALAASLHKIEAEVASGGDDSNAAMSALVEQSRRCIQALTLQL